MTYGFKFYNDSDELVIDDTTPKPWFVGKGTYTAVEVSTDYVIAGYTVYKLTYTSPSGSSSGGAVYISWPPNPLTNVAYCLQSTLYSPGQNIIVFAAVSNNYSPTNADVPQVFCFSLDYVTTYTGGWGVKIFDPTGTYCVFDADANHLKIDASSDTGGSWGGGSALYVSPNNTDDPSTANSKYGIGSNIEYPAFLTPKIETNELVNNGDGTFTRNTYLTFFGRYNAVILAWQPKVRSEIKSGTLSFSGSKLFNNKNYYDLLVQVSQNKICYISPLVVDYTSYSPSGITVNWPSASYSLSFVNVITGSGSTVDEGFGTASATVTTTNITPGTTLRYIFSGTNITASDFQSNSLEGTFTVGSNGIGSFGVIIKNDLLYEGTEVAVCSITRVNGNSITGSPATLTITESSPQYAVTVDNSSISEGNSFTITCYSVKQNADGQVQTVPYTLSQPSGNAFDTNDWTNTVTLGSGSTVSANNFVFANGTNYATRTFYTAADHRTDGDKVLRLTLDNYTASYNSVDVTILDTSNDYTWSLSGPTSVNEGSTYTYTATTNGPVGSTALILLVAPATADVNDISLINGQAITPGTYYRVTTTSTSGLNSVGTFTISYKADLTTEGSEYFTLALNKDDSPYTGTRVATLSGVVNINDTSLTPESWTLTAISGNPNTTQVREGTTLVTRVDSANIPSYPRVLYYKFTGGGLTQGDLYDGSIPLSGTATITSNSQTINIDIREDYTLESDETITLQFYSDNTYTTTVGNSLIWTIHDTLQLTRLSGYITEGYAETITIISYGLNYPVTVYGRITGSGITDAMITGGSKDIQFTLSYAGAINFTVGATANFVVDGVRTATLIIYSDSSRTTQMGNSISWDIYDTSTTTTAISGTPSTSSINEGNSLTYSITTDAVILPKYFYGNITGTNITASDFTSGSTNITNYVTYSGQQFTIGIAADSFTEGSETATLSMYYDSGYTQPAGNSISWTINDTSTTPIPTYSFTRSPTGNIDEGSSVNISWSFTNVPSYPLTLYFTLTGSGITASDTTIGAVNGSYPFSSSTGTEAITMSTDHLTEGTEYITLTWYINSNYTGQVGNSITWGINDTSISYPAYGTYNTSYCSGYTYVVVYNDGSGGTYSTSTANSPTCGYVAPPAAGTPLGSPYCSGYTKYQNYADGNGGSNATALEYNSSYCGYVAPVAMSLSSISAYGGSNGSTFYIFAFLNQAATSTQTVYIYYSLTGYTADTYYGAITINAGSSYGYITGTINTYSGYIYISALLVGEYQWRYAYMLWN